MYVILIFFAEVWVISWLYYYVTKYSVICMSRRLLPNTKRYITATFNRLPLCRENSRTFLDKWNIMHAQKFVNTTNQHSIFFRVSAITCPDRTDAKVYYQSTSPGHGGDAALRRPMSTPPIKNETGTNPYYRTLTDPRGAIIVNKWRLIKCYNSIITGLKHALQP